MRRPALEAATGAEAGLRDSASPDLASSETSMPEA